MDEDVDRSRQNWDFGNLCVSPRQCNSTEEEILSRFNPSKAQDLCDGDNSLQDTTRFDSSSTSSGDDKPEYGKLKIDLGALKKPEDDLNCENSSNALRLNLGGIAHETDFPDMSDVELSRKRSKMAECYKQCTRVLTHLFFGGKGVAENFGILKSSRITHILNCVGGACPEYFPDEFLYKTIWLEDSPSEDVICVLYDVFDFIEDVREQAGGRVFVHCLEGVSRSATLVIAYIMWREHRGYEDVYKDVKQLRSVTSPNIGFSFQLMQWQNRFLGQSVKQMPCVYRLSPQSAYDATLLVPKATISNNFDALDSRGAFVVQLVNRLYVWHGRNCDKEMLAAADRVAFQLVRYENAQGPIVSVTEGREPPLFLAALLKENYSPETLKGCRSGPRLVSEYDKDYEAYNSACSGSSVLPSVGPDPFIRWSR